MKTPETPAHKHVSGSSTADAPVVMAKGVDYTVTVAGKPMQILNGVDLEVGAAEVAAIVGPSGSGKTSLLMLLAGLERATAGRIVVGGEDITRLDEDAMAIFRRRTLSIVFQSFHLIPSLSALDNVGLALEIARPDLSLAAVREQAAAALEQVNLGQRLDHRPPPFPGASSSASASPGLW